MKRLQIILAGGFIALMGFNAFGAVNDCEEPLGSPTVVGPDCTTTGAVTEPGSLSKTEDTICVGSTVTDPSITGTVISDGKVTTTTTYTCPENQWKNTVEVDDCSYEKEVVWIRPDSEEGPPSSFTFDSCGTYSFWAYVIGTSDCCGDTDYAYVGEFTVTVIKAEVKSVQFTSNHGIMKDNNADWTDSGTVYSSPEWVQSPAVNNPISHTKNSAVTLKVTISVCPADLTYDLKGDGGEGYVTFVKNGNTSTGGDQEFTITASSPLPDKVTTLLESITWTVTVSGNACDAGASGAHKIYVTYGTPAGSVVTEKRVADVCSAAADWSTLDGCAGAIATHLNSFKNVFGAPDGGPPDLDPPQSIWMLHAGSPYNSQCPGLADFINKHFQMLGLGAGVTKYCRALPDGTYAAFDQGLARYRFCAPGFSGHPDPTTHDDVSNQEWLRHKDENGHLHNYEAACLFNNYYYAVGYGVFSTPKQVVLGTFGGTDNINWFYYINSTSQEGCDVKPWTEAQ